MYATLIVPTLDDNTTELSEYFKVVINSTDQPSVVEIGSPNVSCITIEDDEPGTVNILTWHFTYCFEWLICALLIHAGLEVFFDPTTYNVTEDMNATLTIRANTSSYSFPFAVTVRKMDITAVAGEDYTPGGYTVSFQPGQDEATLVIATIDDNTVEIEEFYRAAIVNTSESRVVIGSSDMANVTILDNEPSEPAHCALQYSMAYQCIITILQQAITSSQTLSGTQRDRGCYFRLRLVDFVQHGSHC